MVTLFYAALYPQAAVHSFEPVSVNAARIRRHVEAKGLNNVTVHEFGLSGRDASVELAASGEVRTGITAKAAKAAGLECLCRCATPAASSKNWD